MRKDKVREKREGRRGEDERGKDMGNKVRKKEEGRGWKVREGK